MHTPDKTTVFTISRDGEKLTTVTGEFELMHWFHKKHPYSMHHAVTYEGYKITDPEGNNVETLSLIGH